MTDADDDFESESADRLAQDARDLADAARRIRDSIQPWDGGAVLPNHVAAAAQSVLESIGRLGNTLEKAAAVLSASAADAYLDYRGEQTQADDEIRLIAGQVKLIGEQLGRVAHDAGPVTSKLGSIGAR